MKFTFHVLGVPHTKTTTEFTACAFTQKVFKFCKMMTNRGHHVIHYGTEGSNPHCSEHVTVLSNEVWTEVYGDHKHKKTFFTYDIEDKAYKTFYKNAIEEIEKRKKKNDFILPFWGFGVKPICEAHKEDMIVVEPGIGYGSGSWCQFRVFESYAIMHAFIGLDKVNFAGKINWYDVVIPNYFDLNDFDFCEEKKDYMLFLGRVFDGKGINIAVDMCNRIGVKLKVAGQLAEEYAHWADGKTPENVEYMGYAGVEERNKLMRDAKAIICPSTFLEPFAGVQVEAMLCGTPVISSDWGAFSEVNIEGKTGYRCRTMGDFVSAGRKCLDLQIEYKECRLRGEEYSLENVSSQYERYFKDVRNVYVGEGWYTDYE